MELMKPQNRKTTKPQNVKFKRVGRSYRNPKPETRNPKPETRNPKPGTRNPKPGTRNPKPETRNPKQQKNMQIAISINGISKSYGAVTALREVSLSVQRGELFGLIGPDGAGKTTLLRILVSLLKPDSGQASVLGWDTLRDYRHIRRNAGYMAGRFSLYQDLSVEENLRFYATVFGTTVEENYEIIADIYEQLAPFRTRRAGQLSGGMKQKLALCCALIHKPEVLFLDEPTTGVDPVSRREFWDMLARLKARGITMMVSTPYMDEAGLCDRVALMQQGRVLQTDTPQGIVAGYDKPLWAVQAAQVPRLLADLRAADWCHTAFPFGDSVHLATRTDKTKAEIQQYLTACKHTDVTVAPVQAGIEDCFMELGVV
jgi:ABC-2 type transport system ATP-binding protein